MTTTVAADPKSSLLYHEWIHDRQKQLNAISESTRTTIIFLHGMLANSSNIKTMATKVCRVQNCRGLLLDLPGHGQSRYHPSTMGEETSFLNVTHAIQKTVQYALSEKDLHRSNAATTIKSSRVVFFGHSLGGHLSLYYASRPDVEPKPSVLWLLDTVPRVVDASFLKVWNAVKMLQGNKTWKPETMKETLVQDFHMAAVTSQWLQSQYNFSEQEFVFDLNVVETLLDDFANQDFYGQLQSVLDNDIVVHLVQAERNRAWKDCLREIQSFEYHQNFFRHVLSNSGHLVYIDNLPGFISIVDASESRSAPNQ